LKTFIIIGNYGNNNIGDESILEGLLETIETEEDGPIQVLVPVRDLEAFLRYHRTRRGRVTIRPLPLGRGGLADLFRATPRAHKVIIGGGGIWSRYAGFLAYFIPLYALAARFIAKRVEYRGIGVYRSTPRLLKIMLNIAFLFANKLEFRDISSLKNIWKINRGRATVRLDYAYRFLAKLSSSCPTQETMGECMKVGVSVKPLRSLAATIRLVKAVVRGLTLAVHDVDCMHVNLYVFARTPTVIEDDYALAVAIRDALYTVGVDARIVDNNSYEKLLCAMLGSDRIIATRFHSLVFAHVAGARRVLAISYEDKVRDYAQIFGVDWVYPDAVDADLIHRFVVNGRIAVGNNF